MAIALATGSGSTTNVTAAQTLLMPTVGSFKLLANSPNEAVYVNVAGALDQPNKVRHAVSVIPDVFKGLDIEPDAGQRTDGLSILSQITELWKVDDAANSSFNPYYLPVSAHMVIKVPVDALITSQVLGNLFLRLAGSVWGAAGQSLAQAFDPLLRGATLLR